MDKKSILTTAQEAYIYGYPLITMEYTRRVLTNCEEPVGTKAPMGQFVKMKRYPNASFKDVTAPNADTLYTQAFVDVAKEPWILSIPEMNNRYAMFPMLSGWTNIFQAPGKRTTGTDAQKYAITGPNWQGELPADVVEYKSPTAIVWILGRIYSSGTEEDYVEVHNLQNKMSLTPLSQYGKEYVPPKGVKDPSIDMKIPTRSQVHALSVEDYFSLLAQLLVDNPATKEDVEIIKKMKQIGLEPGKSFSLTDFDDETKAELETIPKKAVEEIYSEDSKLGSNKQGWLIDTDTGSYGTDYLLRAFVTAIGLGANLAEDAVYPKSIVDADGEKYSGQHKYVLHFDRGELPPVHGFWSLTMYDSEMFFVDNPLNRYTISERDDLVKNSDGSIDIYIQNENPGKEKEANWLPAPKGEFSLMLRLYWPKQSDPSILNGTWKPSAVTKAE